MQKNIRFEFLEEKESSSRLSGFGFRALRAKEGMPFDVRLSSTDFSSDEFPNSLGGIMMLVLGAAEIPYQKEPPNGANRKTHSLIVYFPSTEHLSKFFETLLDKNKLRNVLEKYLRVSPTPVESSVSSISDDRKKRHNHMESGGGLVGHDKNRVPEMIEEQISGTWSLEEKERLIEKILQNDIVISPPVSVILSDARDHEQALAATAGAGVRPRG